MIMPGPAPKGDAIDAQVQSCEPAEQAVDAAIQTWEEQMSRSNWHGIDPNWRNLARRRLQKDQAVLLHLLVLRKNTIAEGRAPWNRGRMVALGWKASSERAAFYARFTGGSCSDYPAGSRSVFFTSDNLDDPASRSGVPGSPWHSLPGFFHLQLLELLPDEYRTLGIAP